MHIFFHSVCISILSYQLLFATLQLTSSEAKDAGLLLDRDRRASSDPAVIVQDGQQYYETIVTTAPRERTFYTSEFNRMLSNPNAVEMVVNETSNATLAIQLKFLFYFYGHPVSRISVSSNGYIFITEAGHSTGSFPSHIAPLMTEFQGLSNSSAIAYVATNSSVWVQWRNLTPSGGNSSDEFTFQCVIFNNGSMVFHYYQLPTPASKMTPVVKAGLADAYLYSTRVPPLGKVVSEIFVHKSENITISKIVNGSVAMVTAYMTCGQLSCELCMNPSQTPKFNCSWCFQLGQCGTDSQRRLQAWLLSPCNYPLDQRCQASLPISDEADRVARGILGFFLAVFLAMLVAFIVTVCVYGHRRPDSKIGQCLLDTRRQLREKLTTMPRLPGVIYRASNSEVRLQEERD